MQPGFLPLKLSLPAAMLESTVRERDEVFLSTCVISEKKKEKRQKEIITVCRIFVAVSFSRRFAWVLFVQKAMSDDDKSLEDFFAKKAKGKKQKGKSKFTTSDAITKQVGSSQKETDSKSKDQSSKKASGVTPTPSNLVRIKTCLMEDRTDSH